MLRRLSALLLALGLVVATAGASTAHSRFYSHDTTRYTSPWYAGDHRKMIPYGCTSAPYYSPDPRCPNGHGFHHGLDIAMPCGTPLSAGRMGWVVPHDAIGTAYGDNPVLIRNYRLGVDFLLGHTRTVYVAVGERVTRGEPIALASDSGAPDGCHLHFEVRAAGDGLDTARSPLPYLDLVVAPAGRDAR